MAKRKGLGRGLDALLSSATTEVQPDEDRVLRELALDLIERGRYQPRGVIDEEALQELAQSIRARGVVQPIVVRPLGDGRRFELIAGERRWRAAQMAGLGEIPAVVHEVPDDAALAIALIENIQREDLNPLEEARALARLVEEFGLTHGEAADAVGRSRAAVSNLLRLLDLNEDVAARVERGELDMGHARALLGLQGARQSEAAARVVAKELTARQTERLVRRMKSQSSPATSKAASRDPDLLRLEAELSERLGSAVRIEHRSGGSGRLVIRYSSLEELDGVLDRLR